MSEIRKSVMKHAERMEERLQANDHKGGWAVAQCSLTYLIRHLRDEVDELESALFDEGDPVQEAADVANFAMMIADRLDDVEDQDDPTATDPSD